MPLIENPFPVPLPEDMETGEETAARVPVLTLLLPTATLPKSEGDRESAS